MTSDERDRRLSAAEMDLVDLRAAYRHIADAVGRFGFGLRGARPDSCEAFAERFEAQKARADAEWERVRDEIFEANVGVTNDGPDRWSADLDKLNRGIVPK